MSFVVQCCQFQFMNQLLILTPTLISTHGELTFASIFIPQPMFSTPLHLATWGAVLIACVYPRYQPDCESTKPASITPVPLSRFPFIYLHPQLSAMTKMHFSLRLFISCVVFLGSVYFIRFSQRQTNLQMMLLVTLAVRSIMWLSIGYWLL